MGYRFINIGADVLALTAACTEIVNTVAGLTANTPDNNKLYAK